MTCDAQIHVLGKYRWDDTSGHIENVDMVHDFKKIKNTVFSPNTPDKSQNSPYTPNVSDIHHIP